jgi:hypothetical protein
MTVLIKGAPGLLCAALFAVGLNACGNSVSSSFKGEEHEIAQVVANLQTDATAGNEKKICANDLASSLVTRLSTATGGCKQAVKHLLSETDSFVVSVKSVHLNGTHPQPTASAVVTSVKKGRTQPSTLTLAKESGKWKISGQQ